jgi:hypothetical protein
MQVRRGGRAEHDRATCASKRATMRWLRCYSSTKLATVMTELASPRLCTSGQGEVNEGRSSASSNFSTSSWHCRASPGVWAPHSGHAATTLYARSVTTASSNRLHANSVPDDLTETSSYSYLYRPIHSSIAKIPLIQNVELHASIIFALRLIL